MNLALGIYMMERENWIPEGVLLCPHWHVCTCKQTIHTHTIKKNKCTHAHTTTLKTAGVHSEELPPAFSSCNLSDIFPETILAIHVTDNTSNFFLSPFPFKNANTGKLHILPYSSFFLNEQCILRLLPLKLLTFYIYQYYRTQP